MAQLLKYVAVEQAIRRPSVKYDVRKFNWLISTAPINSVVAIWHTAPATTIEGVKKTQVVMGSTGKSSETYITPALMNAFLGTKFKIVTGYKSSSEIDDVLERGEVLARSNSYASLVSKRPQWLKEKKVNILVQVGARRDKALPGVPLLSELATNDLDRRTLRLISAPILMGRPYLAPPQTVAARVTDLRKAFEATMNDKAFRAEIQRLNLDLDPFGGDEVAKVVNETINAPDAIIAKAIAAMPKGGAKKKKKS
jgi:tripartite-type tricarboxylate transporter receptor subunit TctC